MTDLQAILIIIGGTIVVGVVSYNKWQEHKAKKAIEKAFSSSHDDVLMTPGAQFADVTTIERHEPTFNNEFVDAAAVGAPASAPDITLAEDSVASGSVRKRKELPLDALIDCSIFITLQGPIRGEKVMNLMQSLRHVGNKPVHFVGQCENEEWEAVAHGRVYLSLVAGIQLANRSSALNEIEYSELVMRLRQISDDIDAEPDIPDMVVVMQSARGLYQFVNDFDAQLSVNVQSNGAPWEIKTLLAALVRQGFDVRPDGRLVMADGEGGNLFLMSTNVILAAETTSRLTLLLDVPCVAADRDAFGAMVACAKSLASRLDGTVVDDSSQPLSDIALGEIAEQVASFYDEMAIAEIPAGSVRALRLFS